MDAADSDSESDSNSQLRLSYNPNDRYSLLDSNWLFTRLTNSSSPTQLFTYDVYALSLNLISALPCSPPYVPESVQKGISLSSMFHTNEYSVDISTSSLFLSTITALSHNIKSIGEEAFDQLFPFSPSSIFLSTDPPPPSALSKGFGLYIQLEVSDEEEMSQAIPYLSPEIDADDPSSSFHQMSAEEKEWSLVYSFGLTLLFHLTHSLHLSNVFDPNKTSNSLRYAPDDVIHHLSSYIKDTTHQSLLNLLKSILSSTPSKRPTFSDVLNRLELSVHSTR